MYPHHAESIDNLRNYFRGRDDILAVILGGSVAQGRERPDSDLDAMVIVEDSLYGCLKEQNRICEVIRGHCTYEGGYFDIKYMTLDYLRAAADRGSEPTRNSFLGSRILWSSLPEIAGLVERIPVYPVEKKLERMRLFHSILILQSGYFFNNALRADDAYMLAKSTSETVYAGIRMLFALNEVLFPCHKSMLAYAAELPNLPQGILALADTLLRKPSIQARDAFRDTLLAHPGWGFDVTDHAQALSIYVESIEQTWQETEANVYEL